MSYPWGFLQMTSLETSAPFLGSLRLLVNMGNLGWGYLLIGSSERSWSSRVGRAKLALIRRSLYRMVHQVVHSVLLTDTKTQVILQYCLLMLKRNS